jgi:hypothetical protein
MLHCFFTPPADMAASGQVAVVKVPVPAEMAASLTAVEPPLSANRYAGEAAPAREWTFGNSRDPSAASFQLLRVSASSAVLPPSPYAARFGDVSHTEDGSHRFEERMSGYCKLVPAEGAQP